MSLSKSLTVTLDGGSSRIIRDGDIQSVTERDVGVFNLEGRDGYGIVLGKQSNLKNIEFSSEIGVHIYVHDGELHLEGSKKEEPAYQKIVEKIHEKMNKLEGSYKSGETFRRKVRRDLSNCKVAQGVYKPQTQEQIDYLQIISELQGLELEGEHEFNVEKL